MSIAARCTCGRMGSGFGESDGYCPRHTMTPWPTNAPPSVGEYLGYRNCEFCGCHTNAAIRACCDKGRDADRNAGVTVTQPPEPPQPSLACAFKCGWPEKCCVHGTAGVSGMDGKTFSQAHADAAASPSTDQETP